MTKENKLLLQSLHFAKQVRDKPDFPTKYIPPYKHSDNSTNGLTHCVVDFLNYSGHFAERINNTGRYIGGSVIEGANGKVVTQGKYIKGTGRNGRADISAKIKLPNMKYAVPVEIEIKWAKDRMSQAQKNYARDMFGVSAVYWVVRDFDQFMQLYNDFVNENS
jgi:hypothetical protein